MSEQITIDGFLAKDGSKTCNLRTVKLPDGRNVFAARPRRTRRRRRSDRAAP